MSRSPTRKETAPCPRSRPIPATQAPSSPTCSAQGLDDDRYVVERFRSMADGDIRPLCATGG